MDPWLLGGGLADRVEIEVDWVEGCEPGPLTLQGLHDIVAKYGPPGRRVDVRKDETIPLAELDPTGTHGGVDALGAAHANPFVPPGTEHRYVLFVPGKHDAYYGYNHSWVVERDGAMELARGVVVFRRAHARYARLWISLDRLERMTLVHELGHQFGLVTNAEHERRDSYQLEHCTRLECLMVGPGSRVYARHFVRGVFGLFPTDYCAACQQDLHAAREAFARSRVTDPSWADHKRAEREAERAALPLWPLVRANRWSDLLVESEHLLRSYPDGRALLAHRGRALVMLGRLDEALASYRGAEHDGREPDEAMTLARGLESAGRLTEAFEVLGPYGEELDDYDYEQVTFVLLRILGALGRHSEAADRCLALLARGHSISFSPREGMERETVMLLGRAGRFAEADAHLAPLLRGKGRKEALAVAWRLRQAEGRDDEARALAEEALASSAGAVAQAPKGRPPRGALYTQAAALVFLGRDDEARRAVDEMVTADAPLDPDDTRYPLWIRGLALTSRFDEALEAMGRLPGDRLKLWEICSDEDLDGLRHQPPAAATFARCPAPLRSAPPGSR